MPGTDEQKYAQNADDIKLSLMKRKRGHKDGQNLKEVGSREEKQEVPLKEAKPLVTKSKLLNKTSYDSFERSLSTSRVFDVFTELIKPLRPLSSFGCVRK